MASNEIPDNSDLLDSLVEDMADGLNTYEIALGVAHNKEVDVRAALTAFRAADLAVGQKKAAKRIAQNALIVADSNGRAFLGAARKLLVLRLGEDYTAAWEPTGFPNQSTAVPRTQDERFPLLNKLKLYFANVPAHESAEFGVTSALAGTRHTALSDARDAVAEAGSQQTGAIQARETAYAALRERAIKLVGELAALMDADDPRWHAFGLSLPSDPDTPEPVEVFTLAPVAAGAVFVDWERARRATRYRPYIQIVGVDADFRALAAVQDTELMLASLPTGATLRLKLVAANAAGEAPASPVQEIIVT